MVDDRYLTSVEVLDCFGQTTHVLTLLVDGNVRITMANGTVAIVDAACRTVLTAGVSVHATLLDAAAALSGGP